MEREKQRRLEEVERLRQERKRREEGEADRKVRGLSKWGFTMILITYCIIKSWGVQKWILSSNFVY